MSQLRARPGVMSITPYVGGQSRVEGRDDAIKLSSNESPFGPSPAVAQAVVAAAGRLADYPDGASFDLRDAIARKYGLAAERIVCGNGSDELLHLIGQCYLGPDTETIYSQHGFLVYDIVTRAADATAVVVPEADLTAHVDGILNAVTPKTRVVFLANPNNPTGTYLPVDEVRRLHAGLPGNVLLVLDAAYAEYVRKNDYEAGIELVATNDNVVMTRTFSKIYGLAGIRLGWAYCPAEVAETLNKVRPPFNVSSLAQVAGIAALEDQAHIDHAREHNEQWRAWCTSELTGLGLTVTPSVGNFILIHFADGGQAAEADKFLRGRGLILRGVAGYGLPHCLRMTIGVEDACRGVVKGLSEFLGGAGS